MFFSFDWSRTVLNHHLQGGNKSKANEVPPSPSTPKRHIAPPSSTTTESAKKRMRFGEASSFMPHSPTLNLNTSCAQSFASPTAAPLSGASPVAQLKFSIGSADKKPASKRRAARKSCSRAAGPLFRSPVHEEPRVSGQPNVASGTASATAPTLDFAPPKAPTNSSEGSYESRRIPVDLFEPDEDPWSTKAWKEVGQGFSIKLFDNLNDAGECDQRMAVYLGFNDKFHALLGKGIAFRKTKGRNKFSIVFRARTSRAGAQEALRVTADLKYEKEVIDLFARVGMVATA